MSLGGQVLDMFGKEFDRFEEGMRQLSPDQWRAYQEASGRTGLKAGETKQINIPGWDDVVRLSPKYKPTAQENQEYYAARRERRPANLDPSVVAAMDRNAQRRDAIRRSAQPEWAKGWGSILTALDNVQDFLSSMSTFGRLALWAAPSSWRMAEVLHWQSRLAALKGAQTLETRVSAAWIRFALRQLPLTGRIAARFVPGLGWIILASDLLNALSLLGMIASPLFGVACTGSPAALAAGIPTMLFKRGLKSEVWNAVRRNPFGREARLAARAKAIGRLPGVGNLFEVAQTTEQLWGYGLSFGAVVGFLSEASFSAELIAKGEGVSINANSATRSYGNAATSIVSGLTTGQQIISNQAARVLGSAGLIQQYQEHFTVTEHLETLVATQAALLLLEPLLAQVDWEESVTLALETHFSPPCRPAANYAAALSAAGIDPTADQRWPLPGEPETVTGAQLIETLAPRIASATRVFFERHRDHYESMLAGELVSGYTEHVWRIITGSDEGVRFRMTTDYKLLTSLAEDGFLLSPAEGESKLWPLWQDARAQLEASPRRSLSPDAWRALAQRHNVTLIRQLPPTSSWPEAWQPAQER
jgi:hypothetical protein